MIGGAQTVVARACAPVCPPPSYAPAGNVPVPIGAYLSGAWHASGTPSINLNGVITSR